MWQRSLSAILVIAATAIPVAAQEWRKQVLQGLDARADHYGQLSRAIWETAEVGYKETKSSALLRDELKAAGFRIDEGVAGMPTAFVATWGSGKPVIGIMGEFDALPGLSQETVPEQKARDAPAPPGTAAATTCWASRRWRRRWPSRRSSSRASCPARSATTARRPKKAATARSTWCAPGLFNDADVVLHWHPNDRNIAARASTLAVISAKFRFKGIAAHAASAPDKGRSALDAVMVMTHAVDLLREHIPQESRLHYIITKGGVAPNIVPESAEIYMYARHPQIGVLDGIWERILKTAEAGALATGTTMEMELVGSTPELLPNDAMTALLDRNLREVGGVTYTAEERAFAGTLQKTFMPGTAREIDEATTIRPPDEPLTLGSTDAADVSWVVPSGWMLAATYVPGTPGHSWQATSCTGGSIGRKGMMVAAKTLALTAMDLLTDPAKVAAARASFEKTKGDSRLQVTGTRRGRAAAELPGHEVRVKIAKARCRKRRR